MTKSMQLPFGALSIALILSIHGFRKGSLSPSGAFTAFIVGLFMMAGGIRVFGVALTGLYLVGSRATKYGKKRKAQLEDGYHEAGYRSGWQVLCNSASALVAAFVWNAAFAPTSIQAVVANALGLDVRSTIGHTVTYSASVWCPLSKTVAGGWSRILVFATLGHFACCLGDTLASELGILSRSQPRLITTFRSVPPGTNGAMSLGGTLASIGGGAIIGLLMALTSIVENTRCSQEWRRILFEAVGWGMFGGGFGSLIDSVLGATVQRTRYSKDKKVVLQDESVAKVEDIQVISGLNILTNNQVNLASSVLCAAIIGWMSGRG